MTNYNIVRTDFSEYGPNPFNETPQNRTVILERTVAIKDYGGKIREERLLDKNRLAFFNTCNTFNTVKKKA